MQIPRQRWTASAGLVATASLLFSNVVRSQATNTDLVVRSLDASIQLMHDAFPDLAGKTSVRVKRVLERSDESCPPRSPLRAEFVHTPTRPNGHAIVLLYVSDGLDNRSSCGKAFLYVSQFDSLVSAVRPIRKGEFVTEGDLVSTWTETTRLATGYLTAERVRAKWPDDSPQVANRNIPVDRWIREGDLEPAPVLTRGSAVHLVMRRAGIQLTLDAKARESGAPGDIVRVYSRTTNRMYRARILDAETAVWIETL